MAAAEQNRGRRIRCLHCESRVSVRPGQEWEHRFNAARLRIVHCDRDGAIVEQVGRESVEPRWGIRYTELITQFRRAA